MAVTGNLPILIMRIFGRIPAKRNIQNWLGQDINAIQLLTATDRKRLTADIGFNHRLNRSWGEAIWERILYTEAIVYKCIGKKENNYWKR